MKPKARFINSVTQTAKDCDTVMPWTRGARRSAFIVKRSGKLQAIRKSA